MAESLAKYYMLFKGLNKTYLTIHTHKSVFAKCVFFTFPFYFEWGTLEKTVGYHMPSPSGHPCKWGSVPVGVQETCQRLGSCYIFLERRGMEQNRSGFFCLAKVRIWIMCTPSLKTSLGFPEMIGVGVFWPFIPHQNIVFQWGRFVCLVIFIANSRFSFDLDCGFRESCENSEWKISMISYYFFYVYKNTMLRWE